MSNEDGFQGLERLRLDAVKVRPICGRLVLPREQDLMRERMVCASPWLLREYYKSDARVSTMPSLEEDADEDAPETLEELMEQIRPVCLPAATGYCCTRTDMACMRTTTPRALLRAIHHVWPPKPGPHRTFMQPVLCCAQVLGRAHWEVSNDQPGCLFSLKTQAPWSAMVRGFGSSQACGRPEICIKEGAPHPSTI